MDVFVPGLAQFPEEFLQRLWGNCAKTQSYLLSQASILCLWLYRTYLSSSLFVLTSNSSFKLCACIWFAPSSCLFIYFFWSGCDRTNRPAHPPRSNSCLSYWAPVKEPPPCPPPSKYKWTNACIGSSSGGTQICRSHSQHPGNLSWGFLVHVLIVLFHSSPNSCHALLKGLPPSLSVFMYLPALLTHTLWLWKLAFNLNQHVCTLSFSPRASRGRLWLFLLLIIASSLSRLLLVEL